MNLYYEKEEGSDRLYTGNTGIKLMACVSWEFQASMINPFIHQDIKAVKILQHYNMVLIKNLSFNSDVSFSLI